MISRPIPIPADTRASLCRSCQRTIYWTRTAAGRPMPVSLDPNNREHRPPTPTAEGAGHSHFADCPHAHTHRSKGSSS